MSDDIQRLVESLNRPGQPAELGSESHAVDALASALTVKDTKMTPRLTRKARVASFVAAGIIGFGGVAAAGPAVMDQIDGTPESPVATDEPVTTDEPVMTDASADAEEIDLDDPDTDFDENECADGNHGKTVSSVARSDGRTSQDVVDAAQSSCGKDKSDDGDDDADADDSDHDADSDDADSDDDADADEPVDTSSNGNNGGGNNGGGNGGGNGNGNGNGGGNGNGNNGGGNNGGGNNGGGNGRGK